MIEHLRRQLLRSLNACRLPFGMVEAGRGLHQRVEAAALRPRTGMTIGRQRHIDDPRIYSRGVLGRKPKRLQCTRPVALRQNICLRQQLA